VGLKAKAAFGKATGGGVLGKGRAHLGLEPENRLMVTVQGTQRDTVEGFGRMEEQYLRTVPLSVLPAPLSSSIIIAAVIVFCLDCELFYEEHIIFTHGFISCFQHGS
jgi:hypothetical protein